MDRKQGILYVVFGAMTTAVNIGAFALLAVFWPYLLANAVAWVFAVAFAFSSAATGFFDRLSCIYVGNNI